MTTILSDKIITARKPHVCDECLNAINAGEKYHQQCNIYQGDFCVWKSHVDCREIALELNKDSLSDEWFPIHEFPSKCVDEAKNLLRSKQPTTSQQEAKINQIEDKEATCTAQK